MRIPELNISTGELDPALDTLRAEVRGFLAEALADMPPARRAQNWQGADIEFSRSLGERGWIGMTLPQPYGGGGRSMLERYVVTEELLAAGAPVRAHWVGDRQTGPMLAQYGTEAQCRAIIPGIVRGELFICLGMSEPNAGSDLASVRCKATKVNDGWLVNGSKIWTSLAHIAHYMVALLRTNPDPAIKHKGLSQFLIDMRTPGITVRPIRDMRGHEHLNEVFFDNVLLPDDAIIGEEGNGWKQIGHELAWERSGPERYMSSIQLLMEMLDAGDLNDGRQTAAIGKLVAETVTLRRMSQGVAGMLARKEVPTIAAAIVKDLGATLEQNIPDVAQDLFFETPGNVSSQLEQVLKPTLLASPSSSIRGGVREILRGIIAKGLERL